VPLSLQNRTRCSKRSPSGRKRFSRSGRIKSQASVLTINASMSWQVVHTSTTRLARSPKPAHHWKASAGPPPGRPTPLSRLMNKQTARPSDLTLTSLTTLHADPLTLEIIMKATSRRKTTPSGSKKSRTTRSSKEAKRKVLLFAFPVGLGLDDNSIEIAFEALDEISDGLRQWVRASEQKNNAANKNRKTNRRANAGLRDRGQRVK
jgi:hypothetical protein